jgi:hypothetical protein
VRDFGKSDEVMHLLAHLPYVSDPADPDGIDVAPDCLFADWQDLFPPLVPHEITQDPDAEGLRIITKSVELAELAPPHLFGLTCGHRDRYIMVLDTRLGIIHRLPISPRTVISADYTELHNEQGLTKMLQDIYRQHGWPDLNVYNKAKCLEAVRKAMAENYPDSACTQCG